MIILKKENGPRASSAPALGLNTIIFKYVYWYVKQISGERLQDHWSSGYNSFPTSHAKSMILEAVSEFIARIYYNDSQLISSYQTKKRKHNSGKKGNTIVVKKETQ